MRPFEAGHRATIFDPSAEIGLLHAGIVPQAGTVIRLASGRFVVTRDRSCLTAKGLSAEADIHIDVSELVTPRLRA